jgi:hypothetical protein
MPGKNWRCRLGRHSFVARPEDDPEMCNKTYQVCVRCGVRFEPPEEQQMDLEKVKRMNYFSG